MMTYEEVMAFALEHYCESGDGIYECLDHSDYEANIAEEVVYTKEYLLADFRGFESYRNEIVATAW